MCTQWQDNFIKLLEQRSPDVVVTPGTVVQANQDEHIQPGAPERWEQITDTGTQLVLHRGTPRPGEDVADCLAVSGDPASCGANFDRLASTNPLLHESLPEGTHILDFTDQICPDQKCDAVVGNIAVYYDGSHLSTYYVESMVPVLESQLRGELPHLFQ